MLIDQEMTNIFVEIQKKNKPDLIIEVGAFDAEFSHIILEKNLCEKIFAFEASPYVYNKFKNNINKKINYLNLAISNYTGHIDFEVQVGQFDPAECGNNSTLKRNEHKQYNYIKVPCVKLDDYFQNEKFNNICLWIDAEGANREVLTGAEKILEKTQSIFIETEGREFWKNQWLHQDVTNYLISKNFELVKQSPTYEAQFNCIFIKNKVD